MESVATFGEVPDPSDACLVDYLQMAPTADVLETLRDEDPEHGFGANAQAALLRCLRHPVAIAHPPGRPYRERLLKLAALAAERDGLDVDDGLAEAHAEALCEPRTGDQWCHKTFILDCLVAPREETKKQQPVRITVRTHPNLFEGGTGCHEWAAGFALAELVASHAERFAKKRVVEIGPGVGVAAAALVKGVRPPLAALTLLDRDNETLANLTANLELNGITSRILKHDDDDDDDEREAENENDENDDDDAIPKTRVSLSRLDWHDFDPARLGSICADVVVAADVLYDPLDVPVLLDVAAALLGPREEAAARANDVSSAEKKNKTRADEPFALFVSAVRQPETLALFARVAAERGFEPVDATEVFAATKGLGFRRLAKEQRAEIKVHALRPPRAPR